MAMSLFKKLRSGLAKTRSKLSSALASVLVAGRKIDSQLLDELHDTFISADIGVASTDKLITELQDAYRSRKIQQAEQIVPYLKQFLKDYWPQEDRQIVASASPPTVVMIAGINGSGKTTSVAKLAWHLAQQGKKVILGACDTFRAAAIDQLAIWADRAGVEIVKHQHGSDPGAIAYDACSAAVARSADYLLIDTAGRLHTQDNLMRELQKITRVLGKQIPDAPHEVLLVLDATSGQNAVNQAKLFKQSADVSGIFLAKLDGTAKGGIIVAIRDELAIPVKFVGLGEQIEDIEPFDPDRFVDALLGNSD